MELSEQLNYICQREIKCGCYEVKIDSVSIYSFVRADVRNDLLQKAGYPIMPDKNKTDKKALILALVRSVWHLLRLFCSRKRYPYVFYPFARVEKVGGMYMDKFTDPIIDECAFTDYIIFDRGRAGIHPQPRMHSDHIVYIDILQVIAELLSGCYVKKYRSEFNELDSRVRKLTGEPMSLSLKKRAGSCFLYSGLFEKLLKKVQAIDVIGPTRGQQMALFVAAKKLGIQTLELQHGVTYGETPLYSGYRDPMIVPDYFLAFGDNDPKDVYGIEENRIVNIGFALFDYIDSLEGIRKYGDNDILVISDPQITEKLVDIVCELANDNSDMNFFFRAHPHETVTDEQKEKLIRLGNVYIQDRTINIIEVLHGFKYVIGESSTALYEALSMHKKVGRLHYQGLHPLYLSEKDRDCFWQISNQKDFEIFIHGKKTKLERSIYSEFQRTIYLDILNSEN